MMAKTVDNSKALTMNLPGIPAKGGRPASGHAMTNSQRQAKFRRARIALVSGDQISMTVDRLAKQFELTKAEVTRELLRFALCNKNWSQSGFSSQVTKKESI